MDTQTKISILADAAKYDASCASSAAPQRNSLSGRGIGSTEGMGICHSYAPDGRCISLLKLLLTNFCIFNCVYCVNRNTSNVRRARFSTTEVVDLTLAFYRRNYIEGLFLSSGIIRSPDYTMEQLVEVARSLREDHDFRGYIHLKTIPDADEDLLTRAGRYADRLSINVELPTQQSLQDLAPEKDLRDIRTAMGKLRLRIDAGQAERKAPKFSPAGQSTQMIVGADDTPDTEILATSTNLYANYRLKRVYYSAFSPIPDAAARLPLIKPPLLREHRLYQADWLLRFYDFSLDEVQASTDQGMLDLTIDPKLAWALKHRDHFPVDLNTAAKHWLLRVPGLGAKSVRKILSIRRQKAIRLADLTRLKVSLKKVQPFIATRDFHPGLRDISSSALHQRFAAQPQQTDLFAA